MSKNSLTKGFLKKIIVLDFMYGIGFIIYGIYEFLLTIYNLNLYLNKAEYISLISLIVFFATSILFITAGFIEILSGLLLRKWDYLGIKITKIGLTIISTSVFTAILYRILYIVISHGFSGLAIYGLILIVFVWILILGVIFPILIIFKIQKKKEALMEFCRL